MKLESESITKPIENMVKQAQKEVNKGGFNVQRMQGRLDAYKQILGLIVVAVEIAEVQERERVRNQEKLAKANLSPVKGK